MTEVIERVEAHLVNIETLRNCNFCSRIVPQTSAAALNRETKNAFTAGIFPKELMHNSCELFFILVQSVKMVSNRGTTTKTYIAYRVGFLLQLELKDGGDVSGVH